MNYWEAQRCRPEVELSETALKATWQNWATKDAVACLVIMRAPAPGPHAALSLGCCRCCPPHTADAVTALVQGPLGLTP